MNKQWVEELFSKEIIDSEGKRTYTVDIGVALVLFEQEIERVKREEIPRKSCCCDFEPMRYFKD